MEVSCFLNTLTDDPRNFEALDIAGPSHHQGKTEHRNAQQREEVVLIDTVLVVRVICEFAFQNLHAAQFFDVPLDGRDGFLISSASIFHSHGNDGASHNAREDDRDRVVVDLRNVVHQVVALVNGIQTVFVDEPNEFGDLASHEFLCIVNIAPHYQVPCDDFEEDVVGVALLDGVEAVGDGDLIAHVPVIGF